MRAILYINYVGKLHKSAELDVPDGMVQIDVMPDPRMAQFQIFGVPTKMPPLKFWRITGCDEYFGGAVFVAKLDKPLNETGSPI